jgi:hypothetical protein
MAAGLLYVLLDDSDAFEMWLSDATAPLRATDGNHLAPHRQLLSAAAVLAAHGAATLAWHRERFQILRTIVDAYRRANHRWIHLDLFWRHTHTLQRWITTSLPQSALFRVVASRATDPTSIAEATNVLSGLTIVSHLDSIPEETRRTFRDTVDARGLLPTYPGLLPPYVRWIDTLANTFMNRPPIERGLANAVFDRSPDALRDLCRDLTPTIAALMARSRGDTPGRAAWALDVDAQAWSAWCGGQP